MFKSVTRLWNGEIPLPEVFWNWAVFGGDKAR